MAVRVRARINGLDFLLDWSDFEKAFNKATECVEVLDIWTAGGTC